MSLMPFLKNFVGAGGKQAAETLTSALVRAAPELATDAQLSTMEEDLDEAGRAITRLQSKMSVEQKEYAAINTQYSEMMAAAELLQTQMDDPNTSVEKRASLSKSLDALV